jgi:ubiquinone/menaquinone biosynthesis C-methylase UbiE
MMARNQTRDAQDLYDERSVKYDDSHHPRFARHCVELAKVQPGEHVLDLACGTGLVSYCASKAVGPSGSVTGVDISTGMLAQAEAKKPKHDLQNVTFQKHSITELDTLDALKDKQFDLITCCSALVLLPDPAGALKQWVTFLKPGGRLITDVTHPNNLISGLAFERVGIALQQPLPWYRLPFQKAEDLCDIMKAAGLHSIDVKLISLMDVDGSDDLEDYITDATNPRVEKEYQIDDADQVFDNTIDTDPMKSLASPPEVREKARTLFREEWAKLANDQGKVQSIDGVFVGIGWKQ